MSRATSNQMPIVQIPVGEILGREIEAREWSQADFAVVLARPTQFVSEIINGKKEITRESAAQIAAALGTSPEHWLNLQDQYLLAEQARSLSTQVKLDEVRRRARLNDRAPIQLLKKRGVLKGTTLDALELEVMELFKLASIDAEPQFAAAARRADHGREITALQLAWVACVRRQARRQLPAAPYSPSDLRALAGTLSRTLHASSDFAGLPTQLAQVGVRLVYVEALPGAKIDGCAMFLNGVPVIGLSGRGKRLDKVLFTLLHEVAHILLEHVDADRCIVENLDETEDDELVREREADEEAAKWVFPDGLPPVPARVSGPWVAQAAAALEVAPIVLVGRLQKKGGLDWRSTLGKNAPSVGGVLGAWK